MNKTDVETLRATFGVRTPSPLRYKYPPVTDRHAYDRTYKYLSRSLLWTYGHKQSFARIAQADATQIARLPGFGPKKVARLKDAFERPFRTSTTSALAPAPAMVTSAPSTSAAATVLSTERGIDTESRATAAAPAAAISQEQRRLSPEWDIELDLNSPSPEPAPRDDLPTRSAAVVAAGSSKRPRGVSPPWNIELGGPDDDFGGSAASSMGGSDHGGIDGETGAAAAMNANVNMDVDDDRMEDVDVDMESDTDLAPALRAKRRRA